MRPYCFLVLAWLGITVSSAAGPLRVLPPLPSGVDEQTLPSEDDVSSGAVSLGFEVEFLGQSHSEVYVNSNGNVTFGAPLGEYTPFELGTTDDHIIAPFFADVDTTARGSISYGTGLVDGRNAFAVTWSDVGYYIGNADKGNTFQVVLVDRSDVNPGDFDVEFNYDTIEWETGDFSGGAGGFGGNSARAGLSLGEQANRFVFELPGSGEPGALLDSGPSGMALALNSLNSDENGRYVFSARGGEFITEPQHSPTDPDGSGDPTDPTAPIPDPTTVPEPGSLALIGSGAFGLGAYYFRRRRRVT